MYYLLLLLLWKIKHCKSTDICLFIILIMNLIMIKIKIVKKYDDD